MKHLNESIVWSCLVIIIVGAFNCSDPAAQSVLRGTSKPEEPKMQSNHILIEYTVTGGMPPASFESLQIFSNGRVRSLVGNAWAEGVRQSEAGLYETRLDREERRSLDELIVNAKLRKAENTYGKAYPDSALEILTFPAGGQLRKIEWIIGSDLPEVLAVLRNRLNQILLRSKDFPKNVVRFQVAVDATEIELGITFHIKCNLFNPGTDSVSLAVRDTERHPPLPVLRYLFKAWNEFDEKVVPLIQVFEAGKIVRWMILAWNKAVMAGLSCPPRNLQIFPFRLIPIWRARVRIISLSCLNS
jgi:hypothetical protein